VAAATAPAPAPTTAASAPADGVPVPPTAGGPLADASEQRVEPTPRYALDPSLGGEAPGTREAVVGGA
jgi:hypothetical protein